MVNELGLSVQDDLEGQFYGMPVLDEEGHQVWLRVVSIQEAEGLLFLCPTCYVQNGNSSVGTHWIMCWSLNVSQEFTPTPGRWELVGTELVNVSLVANSSSISVTGGCGAHFFITEGTIAGQKWSK